MSGAVSAFFEGTEKKAELIVDPALPSFRSHGDPYWHRIVRSAGADVISRLAGTRCDAYLLSESSLFVFDHRMVMMTCGRTTLHDAVLEVLDRVGPSSVRSLVYKRMHEVFPHDQPTSFFDDVRTLQEHLPGRAYQLGDRDEHHLYLFQAGADRVGGDGGTTVEVLMHGLGDGVGREFCIASRPTTREVRETTGVDRILPGFRVDDHLFRPRGYSLNAVRDNEYYAIHVTPEPGCSYASFETNHRFHGDLDAVVARLLGIFRPRTWDVVLHDRWAGARPEVPGYRLRSQVHHGAERGLAVRFLTYYRPRRSVARAVELQVG